MTTCPQCGAEVAEQAVFCHKCGTSLSSEQDRPPSEIEPFPEADSAQQQSSADPQATATAGGAGGEPTGVERLREAAATRRNEGEDEEEELWSGRYSPRAMVGTCILAGVLSVLLVIGGIYLQLAGTGWLIIAGIILVGWAVILLVLLYRQYSVHYLLTNHRFIHEKGLLHRVTDRIWVIDMDDITFSQGIIQRLLNVGTIHVTSGDRSHPKLVLHGIEDVRRVSTLMDDARRKERRRHGLHIDSI